MRRLGRFGKRRNLGKKRGELPRVRRLAWYGTSPFQNGWIVEFNHDGMGVAKVSTRATDCGLDTVVPFETAQNHDRCQVARPRFGTANGTLRPWIATWHQHT